MRFGKNQLKVGHRRQAAAEQSTLGAQHRCCALNIDVQHVDASILLLYGGRFCQRCVRNCTQQRSKICRMADGQHRSSAIGHGNVGERRQGRCRPAQHLPAALATPIHAFVYCPHGPARVRRVHPCFDQFDVGPIESRPKVHLPQAGQRDVPDSRPFHFHRRWYRDGPLPTVSFQKVGRVELHIRFGSAPTQRSNVAQCFGSNLRRLSRSGELAVDGDGGDTTILRLQVGQGHANAGCHLGPIRVEGRVHPGTLHLPEPVILRLAVPAEVDPSASRRDRRKIG